MIIPSYESAVILGIRISYSSGSFNFKYNTSYQVVGDHNLMDQIKLGMWHTFSLVI